MEKIGFRLSVALAILINLIPIWGVLSWDWVARDFLVLYWIECVIVGLMWVIRIFTFEVGKFPFSFFGSIFSLLGRSLITILHMWFYAIMCILFGAAILSTLYFPVEPFDENVFFALYKSGGARGVYWAALGLIGSHLFSLIISWFAQGRNMRMDPTENLNRIYVRYVVLWSILAIVLIGLEKAEDYKVWALIAMVILKTIYEVYFMVADHRKDAAVAKLPKPRHPSKESKVRRA